MYDAFACELHGGNVAGVVYCEAPLATRLMQHLAAELAAPTTGFVSRESNGWRIRFFTPSQEIDMCGHVTVAVFSSLVDDGLLPVDQATRTYAFTKAGRMDIVIAVDGPRPMIELKQLPPRFRDVHINKDQMASLLGLAIDRLHPSLPLEVVSTGLSHLVVPVVHVEALRELKPKNEALACLSRELGVDTVPVVAFNGLPVSVMARSRDLCPGIGNAEEPASGTTNGALACYMAKHGLRDNSSSIGCAEQGVEMGRYSLIESKLLFDAHGLVMGVSVRGQALLSLTGLLHLPQ
ncbi:PhzF family phenazine biosynthesis protein [Comamonas odontotermitis]|uniref:PhzF family phenazine biosynthesis protein n=1 Tax=Comamonas odontotermitis TaxID=379895 RepID=UPI0021E116F3|nr:PhzF family phenazine biosynthesis protein [Comamonas odontotermitis]